jgi:hypothetical protein
MLERQGRSWPSILDHIAIKTTKIATLTLHLLWAQCCAKLAMFNPPINCMSWSVHSFSTNEGSKACKNLGNVPEAINKPRG